MKTLIAKFLRKTRQQLERLGIPTPAWMFYVARQIKLNIGITSRGPRRSRRNLPQTVQVSPEDKAIDSAFLASLHGSSPEPPRFGKHLLVDLRVAQMHRERGIPRFAQSLVVQLSKHREDVRFSWLIEEGEMPLYEQLLSRHGQFVSLGDISKLPRITHYLQACMFYRSRQSSALFPQELRGHQPALGTIFYDMIPWVLPHFYLGDQSSAYDYMRAAELLPLLDRVFAISECSRIDAVAFGCAPERVTTIYGGWDDDRFTGTPATPPALPSKYWLYIGGDDPRKNISALFYAFAAIRRRMPDPPALVIVCVLNPERRVELLRQAERAGLDRDGLVLPGYVPDSAMGAVIEGAIATIFPSLYEGLGLPVIESYQYGRAALVSDNSSLREIAPPECRFDATRPEAIAEAVLRFHADPAIARASLDFAPRAMEMCSWKAAVRQLSGWLDTERTSTSLSNRLNVVSCLPPDQSGIAIYTQQMLAASPWPIRIVVPCKASELGYYIESFRRMRHLQRSITPPPQFISIFEYQSDGNLTVWVLGNSDHHIETIDLLHREGQPHDFLYLHEARLDGLLGSYHRLKRKSGLSRTVKTLNDLLAVIRPRNILVNSEFCSELIHSLPNATGYRIQVLFLPFLNVVARSAPTFRATSNHYPLTVMHLGNLGESKHPEQIVNACELVRQFRPVKLIFAGYDIVEHLQSFALLRPWIEAKEGLSDTDLAILMQQVDVGIQPRWPQYGESSAAVRHWLQLGKPVVSTAGGTFNEFGGAAWLVSPEEGAEGLAKAIMQAAELGIPTNLDDFVTSRTIPAWQIAFQRALGLTV